MHSKTLLLSLVSGAVLSASAAMAQDNWPSQPITIFVGFPPGGIADAIPRVLQDHLSTELGQPVIVDNRAGAAGILAMTAIAEGEPNHTLGIQTLQNLIVPSVSDNVPYDPRTDLRGVSVIASVPSILAIHPSIPAETLEEFIEYARAHPGELNFGSAGNATAPHLMLEVLNREAGLDIEHAPYSGIGPAYTDLVAGRLHIMIGPFGSMRPHLESLRPLAVSTPERNSFVPDLPPMDQASGIPELTLTEWYALVAPSGMSDENAERISTLVNDYLTSPEFEALVEARGLTTIGTTAEEAQSYLLSEFDRMAAIAESAGVRLD